MSELFHVESSHDAVNWNSDSGTDNEAKATTDVRQMNWIEPFMAWRLTRRKDGQIVSIGTPQWSANGFDGIKWEDVREGKAVKP